ncbi:MAG: VOC family protein [Ignavibacteria bacterium]|nr:VOC family protein [Ignavibacteria bacterium]
MTTINPYLNFNGNTEEAFNFYKSVFGGEFSALMRFKDTSHGDKLSAEEKERIMHVSLPIGETAILMATDGLESMGRKFINGDNFSITIGTDSREEADRIFKELSAGGKVEMPMEDVFWGDYFGMFTDKFGIQWMVSYQKKS